MLVNRIRIKYLKCPDERATFNVKFNRNEKENFAVDPTKCSLSS